MTVTVKKFYRLKESILHYRRRETAEPIDYVGYAVQDIFDAGDGKYHLVYDGEYHTILAVPLKTTVGAEVSPICLGWSTVYQTWYQFPVNMSVTHPEGIVRDAFEGLKGDVYIVGNMENIGNTLRKLFGDPSPSVFSWGWQSKVFTFDDPSQIKKVYKITHRGSGTVVISYKIDGGNYKTVPSGGVITAADRRVNKIQLQLVGTGISAVVDSVSIIFRRMVGAR